jgi:hypothetical protein
VGALKQGARDYRGLSLTALALEHFAGADAELAMACLLAAFRTTKAIRPPRRFQRKLALRFSTELFDKRRQRQARLELNAIHRHDGFSF